MKEICLCVQIHIPAIQSNYRFFNINNHHRYFDDIQLRNHVLKVYNYNVQPFLETLKNIAAKPGERFKVGISISGITLSLFKKFIPKAIELLNDLNERNIIEFLSQTWSNSVLAFFDTSSMMRQINLHNELMKSLFGEIPNVFIAHSPITSPELFTTIFGSGKKRIFTYSNHIGKKNSNQENYDKVGLSNDHQQCLINYMAARSLQEISHNPVWKSADDIAFSVTRKMKINLSGFCPQAIVYNPLELEKPFLTRDSIIWNKIISYLLEDPQIRILYPSEMKNYQNPIPENGDMPGKWMNKCKLPDYWLKSSLQKDAFSSQCAINKLVRFIKTESLINEWDVLQDKEYLYFMDRHFSELKFAETYFNPYSDPYFAYINYMNILDDFKGRIVNQKRRIVKKPDLTDK